MESNFKFFRVKVNFEHARFFRFFHVKLNASFMMIFGFECKEFPDVLESKIPGFVQLFKELVSVNYGQFVI